MEEDVQWRYDTRGSLDGVAFFEGDLMVIAITATVEGRREVVGLNVSPKPFPANQALKHLQRALKDMPCGRGLVPIQGLFLAGLSPKEILGGRADIVAQRSTTPRDLPGPGNFLPSPDFGALQDALTYVRASRDGISPADEIARLRGIVQRSAEGRIVRARTAGFLTPAKGRSLGGELTTKAKEMANDHQIDWRSYAQ